MLFRCLVSSLFFLWSAVSCAQQSTQTMDVKFQQIACYNVENLFDTYDDSLTRDEEYTYEGMKRWTRSRYVDKIKKIAQVIERIGDGEWPLVVGLIEVENRRVLEDLIHKTSLAEVDYGIVHQDSPDRRGIDVALLYRKEIMTLVHQEFLRVNFPKASKIFTRDILYAKTVVGTDTLYFFVAHFPSMWGGEKQSEWKRETVAAVLRQKVDSIFAVNKYADIVIMGDFNGKANTSAQKVLKTQSSDKKIRHGELYNTSYYLLNKSYGSYRYKGRWETIDHIIVSGSLIRGQNGMKCDRRMSIYNADFLLEEDKTYFGFKPLRTYSGPRYMGGFSDHLPVYINVQFP